MFYLGLWAAKFYLFILKIFKKEKDDKPGFVGYKFCHNFLERLNKPKIVIGVTGTNGKTTTTNLIADSLKKCGFKVIYNSWGANTLGGFARCLIEGVTIFNKPKDVVAILEIDEVSCDESIPYLNLSYLVMTNLFRDSMHRNANPDYVFSKYTKALDKKTVLVLNGDDPFSSRLCDYVTKSVFYGIDKLDTDKNVCENLVNDFTLCPKCHNKLIYSYVRYHQIGKVHCSKCDFKSPDLTYKGVLDYENNKIIVNNTLNVNMINDSLFNCYNEMAVISLLKELKVEDNKIIDTINSITIAKSRYQTKEYKGITFINLVAKGMNAVATSRALDYVRNIEGNLEVILLLDDQFDNKNGSEAVAWIYDADFEFLNKSNIKKIVVGGVRSKDYVLRLLLAGVPKEKIVNCMKEEEVSEKVITKGIDKIVLLYDVYFVSEASKIRDTIIKNMKSGDYYED